MHLRCTNTRHLQKNHINYLDPGSEVHVDSGCIYLPVGPRVLEMKLYPQPLFDSFGNPSRRTGYTIEAYISFMLVEWHEFQNEACRLLWLMKGAEIYILYAN